MANWTQPICDGCWIDQHGDRTPIRLREPDPERCAWCGTLTVSGIYVRANPGEVPYPDDGTSNPGRD